MTSDRHGPRAHGLARFPSIRSTVSPSTLESYIHHGRRTRSVEGQSDDDISLVVSTCSARYTPSHKFPPPRTMYYRHLRASRRLGSFSLRSAHCCECRCFLAVSPMVFALLTPSCRICNVTGACHPLINLARDSAELYGCCNLHSRSHLVLVRFSFALFGEAFPPHPCSFVLRVRLF
jgi:hypothetical protein